jgi:hypothetical protein
MKTGQTKLWSGMTAITGAALLALALAFPATAQQVSATAQTTQVVENGDLVDAQFSLTVTNGATAQALGVIVVFEDGQEVAVGDIAPGGSAQSASGSRTLDLSAMPTRHYPVPATLVYSLGGVNVEAPTTVVFDLGSATADGQ